jgi:hypothetical protein
MVWAGCISSFAPWVKREALVHLIYTVKAALEWLDLDRDAIPPGLTVEEQAAG